ncbi:MAG: hypothetical protein KJZ74_12905 [Gemmatimonadales bacterium]|nr:hypothetical protein [Gemmatimonadales bacterium]
MSGGAPALRAELARKALHLSTAALPIGLGLGLLSMRRSQLLLGAAVMVALAVEGARRTVPAVQQRFVALVGGMLRAHERSPEGATLTGATWLALAMFGAALLLPAPAAVVAMWAAAMGDGLASVTGRLASRDGGRKTWTGSAACLVVSAAGAWWLVSASVASAIAIGTAAAIAERPRAIIDDNLRVAAAAGLAAWALLPA